MFRCAGMRTAMHVLVCILLVDLRQSALYVEYYVLDSIFIQSKSSNILLQIRPQIEIQLNAITF